MIVIPVFVVSAKKLIYPGIYKVMEWSSPRIFWVWGQNDFVLLTLEKETLALVTVGINCILFAMNIFVGHLLKRP